jgi:hypothetical protein
VVRRGPPPSGKKTKELFQAFETAGGLRIDPSDVDLRSFVALRDMRDDALGKKSFDSFQRWLIERKPLCNTAFFKAAGLCPPPLPLPNETPKTHNGAEPRKEDPKGEDRSTVSNRDRDPDEVEQTASVREGTANFASVTPATMSPRTSPSEPTRSTASVSLPSTIPVGRRAAGGDVVELATNLLPRHTAIIAGAGSGKTVLLRRLVEEAALAGC